MSTTTPIDNDAYLADALDPAPKDPFTTTKPTFGVKLESAYGAIAFVLIAFAALILGLVVGYGLIADRFGDLSSAPATIAFFVVSGLGLIELATLLSFNDCLKSRLHPVAPAFALMQPNWPRFLRPFIAVWWLAHLALPISALSVLTLAHLDDLTGTAYWLLTSLVTVAGFGLVYATNIYLVLAVAAITPKAEHIFAVWKRRWIIDLAITATAYTAHQLFV